MYIYSYDFIKIQLDFKLRQVFETSDFLPAEAIYIDNIPKYVYIHFAVFVVTNFRQDIMFDFFYEEYCLFALKKSNGKKYLSEEEFEKHLLDFNIKTYIVMDENFVINKYANYKIY